MDEHESKRKNVVRLHRSNHKPAANHLAVSPTLSTDPIVNKIIDMILARALEYTHAEGGSIYLIEEVHQDAMGGARPAFRRMLRFHRFSNAILDPSHPILANHLIEINTESIAGYVAYSGDSVRVSDCYDLDENAPFSFNKKFDEDVNYRTKSVLAIPIKSKNSVIGVVQLVNKRRAMRRAEDNRQPADIGEVIDFSVNDERLIEAFASHAGIALENARLTQDINRLFESFVRASVTAIEARDPSTSGHSDRVAELCVEFAIRVDEMHSGPFKDIRFTPEQIRELRYAALLHDFGKIGVRENVLVKAKKLFPHELETIMLRLDTLRARYESKVWREVAEFIGEIYEKGVAGDTNAELGRALWKIDSFNRQVEEIRRGISVANEPQVLDKDFDIEQMIAWIGETSQKLGQKILHSDEIARLSIPQGTLGRHERLEIESHVSHTYEFLSQIAWTDDLANVADIAHAHHEKLDGTGYPRGLPADKIPLQSRLMTISDIFDALTAMDRPYKKAASRDRALEILHLEAGTGKLDKDLLKIFVEAEIYKVVDKTRFMKRRAG